MMENQVNNSIKLDKETLRRIVVNLRDSGMTFQAISDTLRDDYGIIRTKQAIKGIYDRAIDKNTGEKIPANDMRAISLILNLFCRGYCATEVTTLINNMGYNIPYNKVLNIIDSNSKYINSITETMICNILWMITEGVNRATVKKNFMFENIDIKDNKLDDLYYKAYKTYVKDLLNKETDKFISAGMPTVYKKRVSKYLDNM